MADPVKSANTQLNGTGLTKEKKSKTLVVCFDGTGNEFDKTNTNVVKLFNMLKKDSEDEQMCYYQTGIGTYTNPGILTPLATAIANKLDEGFAWYLDAHVMAGYRFLMQNYKDGDRICIFGFSRGAYTARAFAGMLTKVGVLPKDNDEQIPFAWKMYVNRDKGNETLAKGFRETFSRTVSIEFLGVWDTVASTGIIMSRTLPFTMTNTAIKTFRHALALDERRAKFVPTFYHRQAPNAAAESKNPERTSNAGKSSLWSSFLSIFKKLHHDDSDRDSDFIDGVEDTTDVKEVWFAGCHGDIGGGADPNGSKVSLANIPLRWMIREIVAAQCGILFDTAAMDKLGVHVSLSPPARSPFDAAADGGVKSLDPVVAESPEDKALDAVDAMQPLCDQLKADRAWWIVEWLYLTYSWQDKNYVWQKKHEFHNGRGRYLPEYEPNPLFHETVRLRMQNKALNYKPAAYYTPGSEIYVE